MTAAVPVCHDHKHAADPFALNLTCLHIVTHDCTHGCSWLHVVAHGWLRGTDECGSWNASGSLVKALIVHSATGMGSWDGGTPKDRIFGTPPDVYQGHGRPLLADTLPLAGTTTSDLDLFVVSEGSVSSSSSVTYYYRCTSRTTPLQATLVWYDPPNSLSATKQVLHDLDLTVISPSGTTTYANNLDALDDENNVEKVPMILDTPAFIHRLLTRHKASRLHCISHFISHSTYFLLHFLLHFPLHVLLHFPLYFLLHFPLHVPPRWTHNSFRDPGLTHIAPCSALFRARSTSTSLRWGPIPSK